MAQALSPGSVGIWLVSGRNEDYLIPPLVFGLVALPASAVHGCLEGRPHRTMAGVTLALAGIGLVAIGITSFAHPKAKTPLASAGGAAFLLFILGAFLSQWLAMWLAQQRPRR